MLMRVPYECTDIRFRENLFWIVPGVAGSVWLPAFAGKPAIIYD